LIIGVDPAESEFQLPVAEAAWKRRESHRLSRGQFERWFVNRAASGLVMEACGSAHSWARCGA